MKIQKLIFFVSIVISIVASSSCMHETGPLPKYGFTDVVDGDTINHTIPDFTFINQDSQLVSNESLSDFIYVSDFFFIHCPTICPKVKKQMLKIYDKYEDESMVKFVSHTIDPKRDDVPALKKFASKLGVDHDKWYFLTGEKDDIYDIADDYFNIAIEDESAPEGFDHSGKIILTDKEGHVRAFCEGTDPESIPQFIKDVSTLIDEYQQTP